MTMLRTHLRHGPRRSSRNPVLFFQNLSHDREGGVQIKSSTASTTMNIYLQRLQRPGAEHPCRGRTAPVRSLLLRMHGGFFGGPTRPCLPGVLSTTTARARRWTLRATQSPKDRLDRLQREKDEARSLSRFRTLWTVCGESSWGGAMAPGGLDGMGDGSPVFAPSNLPHARAHTHSHALTRTHTHSHAHVLRLLSRTPGGRRECVARGTRHGVYWIS